MRKMVWMVVVMALAVTACGSSKDSDAGTTGTSGSSTPSTAAPGDIDPAGQLVYGAPFTLSKTFDPHKAALGQDNEWLFPAYDRLVHQTPDGQPEPGLASAWAYSGDGTTLTLTVRSGVTFHDGTVLDAAAVKTNIDRAKSLPDSGVKADLSTISEVRVVDPQTVDLVLTKPDAGLVLKLSDRAGAMISPTALGNDAALANGEAGAGMYELVTYVPGDRAVFEPYAGYWDPDAVKLSRLEIVAIVDPATRFSSLRSGQIDAAYLAPADADAAEAADLTVTPVSSLEVYYLGLNRNRAQFGNEKVRQAMMRAIDREGLIGALLFGMGEPSVQMFPTGYWANDPATGEDAWGYDVEAARQLMTESGVGDFSFDVVVPGPEPVPTMEAIASQLGKIGISVNIRQMEPAQAAQIYTFDKSADAIIGPWSGRPDPSQTVEQLYMPNGSLNVNGGSTPEIEALATKGERTFDQAAREGVYQELSTAMTESALYLPIFSRQRPLGTTSNVSGLVPYLSGKLEFRGVGVTR